MKAQDEHHYWVYIVGSISGTLYVGVTSNIDLRMAQHKAGTFDGFSKKYGCNRLLYIEQYSIVRSAIAREKELKGWRRVRKIALIEVENPGWEDLAADWGKPIQPPAWAVRREQYLK